MRRARLCFVLLLAALAAGAPGAPAEAGEDVFRWRQCAGAGLRVLLAQHPAAEAIKRRFGDFEGVTGIRVAFALHPEADYPARLDAAFADPFSLPDVYMTGTDLPWRATAEERMLALDGFIRTPSQTRQIYNADDFLPGVAGAFRTEGGLLAAPVAFTGDAAAPETVRALAINPRAENTLAAWLLVQYFTSNDFQSAAFSGAIAGGAIAGMDALSPPRRSLFETAPAQ